MDGDTLFLDLEHKLFVWRFYTTLQPASPMPTPIAATIRNAPTKRSASSRPIGHCRSPTAAVRPGGVMASVGVHTDERFGFTPVDAYDKNLTYRIGRCPARHYMDLVLPLLTDTTVDPASIVSHRLALTEGVRAYEIFANRREGCTKVLLAP